VIEFAAIRYLRRAPVEQASRRRIREMLLLALRVTALLLLALAFARPYLEGAPSSGAAATVVLMDASASLSAPDQFARVRARAHEVIRDAPIAEAVAVATFAAGVDVIAPLTDDRAAAHAAVTAAQPGAGATRYRVALARAAELLERRSGRVVVITDLQASGWDAGESRGISERVGVVVVDVGGPEGNLAITSLRAEGSDAVAVVQNFSTAAARELVTFTVDDRPAGAVLVNVPPRNIAEARLAVPGLGRPAHETSPRSLVAAVTDRLGYAADNTRYRVLDPTMSPAVLAVSASGDPSETFFLERALTVADGERGFRFTAHGGSALSDMTAEALAAFDVIAILGTRGIDGAARDRLAAFVHEGGGLLVAAGPDMDASETLADVVRTRWKQRDEERRQGVPGDREERRQGVPGDREERRQGVPGDREERRQGVPGDREAVLALAPDDGRHPVLRPFGGAATLGNVTFRRAVSVSPAETAAIVARYSDGTPALVEEQVGGGRVMVFASDLNDRWNDFPLQPVFVPFVHEVLRYLAAPRSLRSEYLVGEVSGPAGLSPGVATHASRRVAINIDPRESDPERMTTEAFLSGVSRLNATVAGAAASVAHERENGPRVWQIVLMAMVVVLAVEGALGRRLG
jgi:hypothetical protein